MFRTLPQTRSLSLPYRVAGIAAFAALTAIGARVTVEIGPIPLTLQTLAVFLAGMTLGARDGALSQITYVGLIAAGLPLDARGLGPAVFAGPTWGYLLGFILCAFVTGLLVERAHRYAFLVDHGYKRLWVGMFAAFVGSWCVFVPGVIVLKHMTGLDWNEAIKTGFTLFTLENYAKIALAAGIAEALRLWIGWRNPANDNPA